MLVAEAFTLSSGVHVSTQPIELSFIHAGKLITGASLGALLMSTRSIGGGVDAYNVFGWPCTADGCASGWCNGHYRHIRHGDNQVREIDVDFV